MADLFPKHFNSAYSNTSINYFSASNYRLFFDLQIICLFDITQVENVLACLKDIKSVGIDHSSGDFSYTIPTSLCFPLWLLFHKSLD